MRNCDHTGIDPPTPEQRDPLDGEFHGFTRSHNASHIQIEEVGIKNCLNNSSHCCNRIEERLGVVSIKHASFIEIVISSPVFQCDELPIKAICDMFTKKGKAQNLADSRAKYDTNVGSRRCINKTPLFFVSQERSSKSCIHLCCLYKK